MNQCNCEIITAGLTDSVLGTQCVVCSVWVMSKLLSEEFLIAEEFPIQQAISAWDRAIQKAKVNILKLAG